MSAEDRTKHYVITVPFFAEGTASFPVEIQRLGGGRKIRLNIDVESGVQPGMQMSFTYTHPPVKPRKIKNPPANYTGTADQWLLLGAEQQKAEKERLKEADKLAKQAAREATRQARQALQAASTIQSANVTAVQMETQHPVSIPVSAVPVGLRKTCVAS